MNFQINLTKDEQNQLWHAGAFELAGDGATITQAVQMWLENLAIAGMRTDLTQLLKSRWRNPRIELSRPRPISLRFTLSEV